MSRSISRLATPRRLARACGRILTVALPALAACQAAGDGLAPEAGGDVAAPAADHAAATAEPLGALATNRIAYSVYTADGGTDIWTMDPQGGSQAHLTSFTGLTGWEYNPSWSFNHQRIAFEKRRSGYTTDIYLMNADGSKKGWARSATYAESIDMPSWSPDGTNLLVRVSYQQNLMLGRIDLASGNLSLVAPQGVFAIRGQYPVYGPTGKTIYFLDNDFQTIKSFSPNGPLTTVYTSSSYISDLALSPDGTRIAYVNALSITNGEIYVLNLATKTTKRLTYNSALDGAPAWSPDGSRIAFHSKRSGTLQIWTMNSSTGGGLARITSRANGAGVPSWSH